MSLAEQLSQVLQEEVTRFNRIANQAKRYTDQEMKELLDGASIIYNSNDSNLMTAEMNKATDAILLDLVSKDSSLFFGVSVENWQTA